MSNILLIMGRELGAYMRTPSGYLIAAFALLLNALQFNSVAVGDSPQYSAIVLETFLFNAAFITEATAVLFSMRMLAEERSNGVQTLLFTSPIREGEIVIGKFLSSLVFLSIVVLLSLYLPALIFVNGKVSIGHIAGGYGGMILLGAAILAVGMLASALSPHPFVSVLVAAFFVGILELSWFIARISDPPLQDVIAHLAPVWKHYTSFRQGLIQLSDIVFYLSMIYISLLAATRVLQSQRWR